MFLHPYWYHVADFSSSIQSKTQRKDQVSQNMSEEILRFPEGFLWGTVAAAHQVEGNNRNNDWWEWEQRKGTIRDGSVSGEACHHYGRFEEDFELLQSLGANAHRLSLEWSRLEPEPGTWSKEAVEHYEKVLSSLTDKGIVPFVTLHHYTVPLWFARRGGWESETAVEAFETYARQAVRSFGAHVRYWVTINAPVLYAYRGWVAGIAPPGAGSRMRALRVWRDLLKAHGRAYHAIHEEAAKLGLTVSVGLAQQFIAFDPFRKGSLLDGLATLTRDYYFNELTLNSLYTGIMGFPLAFNRYVPEMEGSFDFVGLNYCTRRMTRFSLSHPLDCFGRDVTNTTGLISELGQEIHPEGLYRFLERAAKFAKPIYVTENGIATDDDGLRSRFIVSHVKQVHDAIQLSGDIRGYFYYSLMDGFEWRKGYRAKTGLIDVDRSTLERRVKPSGRIYARMCRENGIPIELVRHFCPDEP